MTPAGLSEFLISVVNGIFVDPKLKFTILLPQFSQDQDCRRAPLRPTTFEDVLVLFETESM